MTDPLTRFEVALETLADAQRYRRVMRDDPTRSLDDLGKDLLAVQIGRTTFNLAKDELLEDIWHSL